MIMSSLDLDLDLEVHKTSTTSISGSPHVQTPPRPAISTPASHASRANWTQTAVHVSQLAVEMFAVR